MIAHDRSHASRILCIDCPIWARFKASGEQDLDGFEEEAQGEEEDDDEPDDEPDDDELIPDDDDGDEAAACSMAAELDAAEQELEGKEGPVDAPRLLPAPRPRLLPAPHRQYLYLNREPSSWKDPHHHRRRLLPA